MYEQHTQVRDSYHHLISLVDGEEQPCPEYGLETKTSQTFLLHIWV